MGQLAHARPVGIGLANPTLTWAMLQTSYAGAGFGSTHGGARLSPSYYPADKRSGVRRGRQPGPLRHAPCNVPPNPAPAFLSGHGQSAVAVNFFQPWEEGSRSSSFSKLQ